MTQHLVKQQKLDQALKNFTPVLDAPQASVFGSKKINHFSAKVHDDLAQALVNDGRIDDAVRVLSQVPDHAYLTEPFRSFGRTVCKDGNLDQLEQWLPKLPHDTARVYARLGAFNAAGEKHAVKPEKQ